jgi:cell division protein FtsL
MYEGYDFEPLNITDLNNKLFCTFTSLENLENLIDDLNYEDSIKTIAKKKNISESIGQFKNN